MEKKREGIEGIRLGKHIMCHLFCTYLKILEKTVKIDWVYPENFRKNHVIGFWHEDSYVMNLVLKEITEQGGKVSVLVTADGRGDYIQYMLEKYRGEALRMGHGFCNAGLMREILNQLKEKDRSIAIAMDGPLGPRHIPKKTTFFLSEHGKVPLLGITVEYSDRITLRGRWDHYRIPLPFSKITVRFDDYGITSCQHTPRLKVYQREIECGIMGT